MGIMLAMQPRQLVAAVVHQRAYMQLINFLKARDKWNAKNWTAEHAAATLQAPMQPTTLAV
jgi:hypothetical protein